MTNPTSNFGWQMPTSTDLVTDLPADFEVFGQAVDTDFVDLLGGANGYILSKASAADLDFAWIPNDQGDITAVNVTAPITGGGSSGAVTIGINAATTSVVGAVQLSDSTSTTSSVLASTPTATKAAYDLANTANTAAGTAQTTANAAIPKSTVTTAGDVIYATGSSAVTRLGIGSAGQVLTVASGVPSWATPGASGFVGCLVAGNTQSIPNSTATAVLFASTELFDTNTFHSTATNTSRITIPSGKAGYYAFFYSGTWEDANPNSRQIKLYKNGTALSQVYVYQKDTGSGYWTQQFYTVLNAAVSDYFEVYVEQLSGGAKAIYGDSGAGSLPGLRFGCTFLGA